MMSYEKTHIQSQTSKKQLCRHRQNISCCSKRLLLFPQMYDKHIGIYFFTAFGDIVKIILLLWVSPFFNSRKIRYIIFNNIHDCVKLISLQTHYYSTNFSRSELNFIQILALNPSY